MSRISDLLEKVISKVNDSIKKTPQSLTPEEQAQAKANLGISEGSGGGDWAQNDPDGPGYIQNRTHSRVPTKGSTILRVDIPSEFVEEYEEDGVTKYRWTQEQFEVTASGEITPPKYNYDTYTFYDKQVYAGGSSTQQLVPAVFTGNPEDMGFDTTKYGIDINCAVFRLYRPEGGGSWVFTPYVSPGDLGYDVGKFYVVVSDVSYSYSKLDVNYLPTTNIVSDTSNDKSIPHAKAVNSAINYALENNVNYFNLQNAPAYNVPESYEKAILPDFDSIEGYLGEEISSPVVFRDSYIKLWPLVGSLYRVYFEGQYYKCTCYDIDYEYRIIGNASYYNSEFLGGDNEPFCVIAQGETVKLYFDSNKLYTGKFYVELVHEGRLKRLEEDLLPEGIASITEQELQDLTKQLEEGVVVNE